MREPDGGGGMSDRIERQLERINDRFGDLLNKRQGDDIVAYLQDLVRTGIAVDASELGSSIPDDTLTSIETSEGHLSDIADAATDISGNTSKVVELLGDVAASLELIYGHISDSYSMVHVRELLVAEAEDRAKQRRYMRFNLVQDIADWERRVVEDDDTLHAEGMLLRLREELEVLDDLWPDTVALVAVQR